MLKLCPQESIEATIETIAKTKVKHEMLKLCPQESIEAKIETIAKEIYGADGIELEPAAQEQIERYKKQVCLITFI